MHKSKATSLSDDINSSFNEMWTQQFITHYSLLEKTLIQQACMLANLVGAQRMTPIGLSCLTQGLITAEILAELKLDADCLSAAICCPSVQYAELDLEKVAKQLNPNVAELIKGAQRMDAMPSFYENISRNRHSLENSIDNLRKMLLAIVSDVRIVILKLAERICMLRHCKSLNIQTKTSLAKEAMDIYAPLANRLGIGYLKSELEDLAFQYLDPEQYKMILNALKLKHDDRESPIKKIIAQLEKMLADLQIKDAVVSGRVKHIFSIYYKMQRKHVNIDKIYDASAVRILVPSIEDCYATLAHVHANWQPISEEFDDYITNPKSNGYRSIHTAVIGPDNKYVEIQIRTHKMHEEAEFGIAAHWKYKENKKNFSDYEQKIAWLRQIMAWQKEMTASKPQEKEIYQQIFNDRIYVFTPNSDVIDLPIGSTPLDFAYHIHTEIGHRCRGAKINGKLVNLAHQLKTGDKVEIITSKESKPSRDWLNPNLNYLHTTKAKTKAHHWFRKHDLTNSPQTEVTDLSEKPLITKIETTIVPAKIDTQPTDIQISGIDNLLSHIAQCCKPIPGDDIIGYITINQGVSIHRSDCSNILRNKKNYQERLVEVNWGKNTRRKYPVDVIIDAYNHNTLIKDITNLLANEHIAIIHLTSTTDRKDPITHLTLTIEIDNLNPLSQILNRIQRLPNILNARRN